MSESTRGRYFEELTVGEVIPHAIRRTVTETDNLLFCALTHNPQPLHLDEEFCKGTLYGRRIVNSIFTLGLVCGVSVADLTFGTTLGNLGFAEIKFTNPVFIGDTLRAETEVLEARASKSRSDAGIVQFETRGFNQRNEIVTQVRRISLMLKVPRGCDSRAS
jgi:acyl dehydratase